MAAGEGSWRVLSTPDGIWRRAGHTKHRGDATESYTTPHGSMPSSKLPQSADMDPQFLSVADSQRDRTRPSEKIYVTPWKKIALSARTPLLSAERENFQDFVFYFGFSFAKSRSLQSVMYHDLARIIYFLLYSSSNQLAERKIFLCFAGVFWIFLYKVTKIACMKIWPG